MSQQPFSIGRHFLRLPDPRVRGRCDHLLLDIVAIAICAVISGADDWQEIELFGKERLDWLKQFLKLPAGIPSHDTFCRVFERLDPKVFGRCFFSWTQSLAAALGLQHIAIDGKTLCGSGQADTAWGRLHLVSAWASANHLSLGQVAVDAKSNEVAVIPQLLALLDVNGALVTLDAMGCQKKIAKQIVDGGGDYALIVKDNQKNLHDAVIDRLGEAMEVDYVGYNIDEYECTEKGHGRVETRGILLLRKVTDLPGQEDWSNLNVIGMYTCERTLTGKETTTEVRYFIGSRNADAAFYARVLRSHWSIENSLHWQLDVTFGEDANRTCKRNSAENLAVLRKIALVLLKRNPNKASLAKKRLKAALNPQFLEEVLFRA